MNVFTASGNLGKDAEVRHTSSGTAIAGFSVAVKAGYGERESTLWINCSIFGKRAEGGLIQYLTKGQEVVVSGELSEREWQGNDGATRKNLELKVNEITLVGGKSGEAKAPHQPAQKAQQSAGAPAYEEDVPFNCAYKRAEYIV